MFRGGSFDRSGAGLELHEEWKGRREVELSKFCSDSGGFRNPRTSAQHPGIEPGHHKGVGPRGVGKAQDKGFLNGTDVVSNVASPRSPVEIARNQAHMFGKHHGSDREDELFPQYDVFCRRYR